MYYFHYNFIMKKFDAELLFTDTYSFTYEIKSENVDELDFSNFSKDSKFFNATNKKFTGKMKDDLVELL